MNIPVDNVNFQSQVAVFRIVIFSVASLYFPAILCLFTPTEVRTEEGSVNIILHGTSPVGIRSFIANFLSSHAFSSKRNWKKVLVLLVLVSAPAASDFVEYVTASSKQQRIIYSPLHWVTFVLAFLFGCRAPLEPSTCQICEAFGDKRDTVHDKYDVETIKMHLRVQLSIVCKCWRNCFDQLKSWFQFCGKLWSGLRCAIFSLKFRTSKLLLSLLLPGASLIAVVYLAGRYLLETIYFLFYSCPSLTFFYMVSGLNGRRINLSIETVQFFLTGVTILFSTIYCGSTIAKYSVIVITGVSVKRFLEYLPIASLVVVIAYYTWLCWSSFTGKYDNLLVKLCKHYGAKTQDDDNELDKRKEDNTSVIPKDLFEEACKKLKMPLGESRRIVVLKIIAILTGIVSLFAVIMAAPGSSDTVNIDIVKAAGMFLTMSLPKISEMLFNKGSKMKELEDDIFDKRVKYVVDEYVTRMLAGMTINANARVENEGSSEINIMEV